MCFGGSVAPQTNVTPAPYTVNNSQSAVTTTQGTAPTVTQPHGLQPDAYDPNVSVAKIGTNNVNTATPGGSASGIGLGVM